MFLKNTNNYEYYERSIVNMHYDQGVITLDDKHIYHYINEDVQCKCPYSVTKIINPHSVPDFLRIKIAAEFGTLIHDALDSLIVAKKNREDIPLTIINMSKGCMASFNSILNQIVDLIGGDFCEQVDKMKVKHRIIGKAIFADGEFCFGATPDLIFNMSEDGKSAEAVVEFKTTSSKTRDHLRQLAAYMILVNAPIGVILYDRQNMVVLRREEKNFLMLIREFYQKAAVALDRILSNDIDVINSEYETDLLSDIAEVNENIKALNRIKAKFESVRDELMNQYLISNATACEALDRHGKICFDNDDFSLSYSKRARQSFIIKNIESFRNEAPEQFNKFVEEKVTTSYVFDYKINAR